MAANVRRRSARPADEGDAAVVGDVEPLVSVGRPRVGAVEAGDELGPGRVGPRPQPEGAVDVQPAGSLGQPVGDLVERVERAGVDLAGLGADQHRPGELGQIGGAHPTLLVGRHDDDAAGGRARRGRATSTASSAPARRRRRRTAGRRTSPSAWASHPSVGEQGVAGRRRGPRRWPRSRRVTKATPVPVGSRSRSTSQRRDDVVERRGDRRHRPAARRSGPTQLASHELAERDGVGARR